MHPRVRNLLMASAGFVLARLAVPVWDQNVQHFAEERGWNRALDAVIGAMPEWIASAAACARLDGFWGGAFSVLAIWGCLEAVYAARRRRARAAAMSQPATGRPQDGAPSAAGMPADAPEPELQFVNRTAGSISIFWMTPSGSARLRKTLHQGGSYGALTYPGHQWLVLDANGRELARYVATGQEFQQIEVRTPASPA